MDELGFSRGAILASRSAGTASATARACGSHDAYRDDAEACNLGLVRNLVLNAHGNDRDQHGDRGADDLLVWWGQSMASPAV